MTGRAGGGPGPGRRGGPLLWTACAALLMGPACEAPRCGGDRASERLDLGALIRSKAPQQATIARYLAEHARVVDAGPTPRGVEAEVMLDGDLHRVLGGFEVVDRDAVGLLRKNGRPHCTATVVASRTLLTAAHCLAGADATDGYQPATLTFTTGFDPSREGKTYPVEALWVHPDYRHVRRPFSLDNDVGLAFIDRPFEGAPIPLAPAGAGWEGEAAQLFFIGYGVTRVDVVSGGEGAGRRMGVKLPFLVDGSSLRYGDALRSTCHGDSGGPALWLGPEGDRVVGVVSWTSNWLCNRGSGAERTDPHLSRLMPLLK